MLQKKPSKLLYLVDYLPVDPNPFVPLWVLSKLGTFKKFKFETGNGTGNSRAVRPEVVQKLSTLTSCGVQVIDYVEKLNELKGAMETENCAPVFTVEELL